MIDASEDLARLEYAEAHIALQAGVKPDHPDYVVSNFGRVGFTLYAHGTYVQKHGLPAGADDLDGHKFLVPQIMGRGLPFGPWINDHVKTDMIAMSSRDIWVSVEAIAAGVGIGFIGDHKVKNRRNFHAVLPPNKAWSVPAWLVTHVDMHRTQKVQAMLACLKAASLARPTDEPNRSIK